MLKILRCNVPQHQDGFREMLDIWGEQGYCQFDYADGNGLECWLDPHRKFLLWDYDRIDVNTYRVPSYSKGLFGNAIPSQRGLRIRNYFAELGIGTTRQAYPWTYFARHPKQLEAQISTGVKGYDDRPIESIFLGKVENKVQLRGRTQIDWSSAVQEFSMPITVGVSTKWLYSQSEYLSKLAESKFGLLLPGHGPKCNRDIECMGLGTVPIVTPGCDVVNYHEPWQEGRHYIRAASAAEVCSRISEISKEQWKYMHAECLAWYHRNASPLGSYSLTEKLYYRYR